MKYYSTTSREVLSGIYGIINKLNGKIYVGSSKNIYSRWRGHQRKLFRGVHKNDHLQSSWDKHGGENFEFVILLELEADDLTEKEQEYVELYDSINPEKGYNRSKANPTPVFTDEMREKLSKSLKGRKLSEETKRRMSESRKGRKLSEETKAKISSALSGVPKPELNEQARKNISEGQRKRVYSKEEKERLSSMFKDKKRSEETKEKIRKTWEEKRKEREK